MEKTSQTIPVNKKTKFGKDSKTGEATAIFVSTVSILANALLSIFKLLAGIFAHSGAMISDAIHSASDVFSSIIVIIGVKIASKDSDEDHPYGHDRFECVAAVVLSVVLLITGLMIGRSAVLSIADGSVKAIETPGVLALAAALCSILVKEGMYWYTRHYAVKLDSSALMADAWHHRSDALSSIGALVGIWGARAGIAWLDAAASIVICGFIVKAAYDIFMDAIEKMVDHACSEDLQNALIGCAAGQPGVVRVRKMKTREFGSRIYVDIEVTADENITLRQSHGIAECVHKTMEKQFPKIKHITVRVVPDTIA